MIEVTQAPPVKLPIGSWFLMNDVIAYLDRTFPEEAAALSFKFECMCGEVIPYFEDANSQIWIGYTSVQKFFTIYFDNETIAPSTAHLLTPRTIAEQNFRVMEVYVSRHFSIN
jgi:hypothetical protein